MSTVAEMIAQLPVGADVVPLGIVGDIADISREMRTRMVREGVIPVLDRRGAYGAFLVTREEAMLVLAGAALAVIAGIAVTMAIRAVSALTLDPVVIAAAIAAEARA
jgi:hypothetical protein